MAKKEAKKPNEVVITMDEFIAANTVKVVPGAMTVAEFSAKIGKGNNAARLILLRGVREGKLIRVNTVGRCGKTVLGFLPKGR